MEGKQFKPLLGFPTKCLLSAVACYRIALRTHSLALGGCSIEIAVLKAIDRPEWSRHEIIYCYTFLNSISIVKALV